ncbi:GntR family transcriptional regulator [Winogradskyella sp. APC 3343]|uniref:GntR family transcriptional regulator n=2 Tax=Winogradskyella bathintestinalis TaxID=3035208 RepID=A0ABT7ZR94_9FLAO|nr:GntR family transcriptional regulator [Winogradskyella bathintestinalis]
MINVKNHIGVPKYKQIINAIEKAISEGELQKGDQIPSINQIKNDNKLSRDTVLTAFNELKNRGIITSIVGKGYYVSSENVTVTQNIFLLFDELNSFKEDLYNAFIDHLGSNIKVDIYFHHFNRNTFKKIISDNKENYNYYVIMPANFINTKSIIGQLPKDKVYILDQLHSDLKDYPAVYQNFEKSIFNNLTSVLESIKKYQKLILVFSDDKQPDAMQNGFIAFCENHNISYGLVEHLKDKMLQEGELYIIPEDKDLLRLIKKMKTQGLIMAQDIGVISYNETLLKEIVEGGITTISTDFEGMGKRLAEMILAKDQLQIENPNQLIIRNSL